MGKFVFSGIVTSIEKMHRCTLMLQLMDMRLTVTGLEKERDFYFGKLRDIEVLCQDEGEQAPPIIQKILDILYATEVSLP